MIDLRRIWRDAKQEVIGDLRPRVQVNLGEEIHESSDFLASAHNVWSQPAFKRVIEHLMNQQIAHAALDSPDWQSVVVARSTINGLDLMLEEFERLESAYQTLHRKEEPFNKHEIL